MSFQESWGKEDSRYKVRCQEERRVTGGWRKLEESQAGNNTFTLCKDFYVGSCLQASEHALPCTGCTQICLDTHRDQHTTYRAINTSLQTDTHRNMLAKAKVFISNLKTMYSKNKQKWHSGWNNRLYHHFILASPEIRCQPFCVDS